uniref:sodium/hydrogen exchanger 9B1 isoform X1 n=2 Tax=Callithrix jacchus TaxID=9483 RepID=UPI0023DD2CFF|nr:sodium/hydrogen exchanger 9B1 isoform X1 [Callithrix jacchus]XP_054109084.1 sodium/hydrogen exchanger 9B1 isoform X1 [Callithrix jacchus]XP_054109085.1 sodium/hydrogen exchanger 9B1 isoform X1 [Callithrix jacchus]XP_054109086.1 sodium/hydrogen exchanger 9B1 isoform X1 [Callithrix jacchus]
MYTTESKSEYLEDENFQTSTNPQSLIDPNSIAHGETKTVLSDTEETKPQRKEKTYSSCPLRGVLNVIITNGVILIMIWCLTWSILGSEALPGGNLFGLLIIFYSAIIGGKFLELIRIPLVPPLPPLLGMLLAGFMIRNVPFISKHIHVDSTLSSVIRNIALTVILIRAGLGLDPQALKHLKEVCFRLAAGPCLIEASAAAVFSHFIMKFPWQWAFLLGFVLGAVSPAVVVPSMLLLQENGYGIKKGIPTLLMAASSMDDILAITGFNTCLSIVFSTGKQKPSFSMLVTLVSNFRPTSGDPPSSASQSAGITGSIVHNILYSIRNVCVSLLAGTVLGFFLRYFPSEDQEELSLKRGFLVLTMCVSAVLGSQRIGLLGSGGLCTLVLSFIAGTKWSQEKMKVQKIITNVWDIFQPLLFGLVGAEVSVSSLESNTVGISVATVSLALCVRMFTTYLLMCFAGFSFKEKIFIACAWMPKATVQAVLGPLALETARISAPHLESYSKDVMTVAFLAILITAPNGALLIGILGPKMLTRHYDTSEIKKLQLSTLEHN